MKDREPSWWCLAACITTVAIYRLTSCVHHHIVPGIHHINYIMRSCYSLLQNNMHACHAGPHHYGRTSLVIPLILMIILHRSICSSASHLRYQHICTCLTFMAIAHITANSLPATRIYCPTYQRNILRDHPRPRIKVIRSEPSKCPD